jgi:hypothetical protein
MEGNVCISLLITKCITFLPRIIYNIFNKRIPQNCSQSSANMSCAIAFINSLFHAHTNYPVTHNSNRQASQKKKVVGLERGPLILVSTTEELLDRKVAAPV